MRDLQKLFFIYLFTFNLFLFSKKKVRKSPWCDKLQWILDGATVHWRAQHTHTHLFLYTTWSNLQSPIQLAACFWDKTHTGRWNSTQMSSVVNRGPRYIMYDVITVYINTYIQLHSVWNQNYVTVKEILQQIATHSLLPVYSVLSVICKPTSQHFTRLG